MGLQCHYSKFTSKFKGTSICRSIYHFCLLFGIDRHPDCCSCLMLCACPGEPEPEPGRCVWQGAREVPELSSSSRLSSPLLSARGGSSPAPRPGQGISPPELPGLPRLATSLRPFLPTSSPTAGV